MESRQIMETQIDHEMSVEVFDERRVHRFKAQIYQLEKQIVFMANAVAEQKEKLLYASSMVQHYNMFFRRMVETNNRSVTLSIKECEQQIGDSQRLLERLDSAQGSPDVMDTEVFTNCQKFLRQKKTPTMRDICSGSLKHINLSQVTKLEHSLAALFKSLHSATLHRKHSAVDDSLLERLDTACNDLLSLSLLVPQIPWSDRLAVPEITPESLMRVFPRMSNRKQQEVKSVVDSLLKLVDHRHKYLEMKISSLEEELKSINSRQTTESSSADDLLEHLVQEQQLYHRNLIDVLIDPVTDIARSFQNLSNDHSDDSLKNLLQLLKKLSPQLLDACDAVRQHAVARDSVQQLKASYKKSIKSTGRSRQCCGPSDLMSERDNELKQNLIDLMGRVSASDIDSTAAGPEGKTKSSPQKPHQSAAHFIDRLENSDTKTRDTKKANTGAQRVTERKSNDNQLNASSQQLMKSLTGSKTDDSRPSTGRVRRM